ncbi:E3 ubiquitin-protein ligase TRIM36-like [Sinocyclocheilus grahami]|uniref:E3 ubiquitin-protein ligase TRIM36-like n=1 Tax=Sinocyclocheilus grahami TaxID=75366 RepID=UPI0007ACAA19|nr:PREDICTED: E3 ubiquitin-protein ligase TRIM36-like [Sinocyclocheilus grahami]
MSRRSALLVPMKSIERELICPICEELFTQPLVLPCQHSVCHRCVRELLMPNHDDSLSTDAGSESSNPGSPRARGPSPSMEKLERLVRSASLRRSFGARGRCGLNNLISRSEYCVSRPPVLSRAPLCVNNRGSNHGEMTLPLKEMNICCPKAQHEYVGPTTNFRPKVLMCPEHEMEKVNMYCEVCRRPVCHLCKLGGSHANHRVTSMSSAYKILKEKLSKSIHYLISKEDQVRTQISELEEMMRHTEENGQLAERHASEHFEHLFETLQERRTEMLRSIEQSRSLRVERLRAQVEEYQGMLENSGLVGYAQEVLKETDQSCFVQTAKLLHVRIQKATESLKMFQPAATQSFEEFVLDTSKEELLLKELSFSGVPAPPVIDLSRCRVYNEGLIHWRLSEDSLPTDHHIVEFRKLGSEEEQESGWSASEPVFGCSTVLSDLSTDSSYTFRVKSCRNRVYSPSSPEVTLHTPPAPVLSFLFNEKCGFSAERLQLSKRRDSVESVAGMSLLLAAERVQTGNYICLDYIIGDTGIAHGRHYWAFRVQPDSYMIKVGVASDSKLTEWFHNPRDTSSPRYDHDSGHDSGSEDACFEVSQPFMLVTVGMGRLFIPKASASAAGDHSSRVLPMPQRIGVCLDYDAARVFFYDADTMRCVYERPVDCSGTMFPAFGLLGGGAVHLEEFITAKRLSYL